jgi:hypothetical protein
VSWPQWGRQKGIPTRLLEAGLEATSTPALERVRLYLRRPENSERDSEFAEGCCLVLTGPTGVGKTFAAAATLREAAIMKTRREGKGSSFWYFPALCTALLDPERRAEALERATQSRFAVFDDLGVGGRTHRHLPGRDHLDPRGQYLPTIITTNLTTDQIKQRLPGSPRRPAPRGLGARVRVPGAEPAPMMIGHRPLARQPARHRRVR